MDKKEDIVKIRDNTEILLKPIWEYLAQPQAATLTENGLNGGIRIVDLRRHASVHTTLMQAVHSGYAHRAGIITLNTERHIHHLPGYHLSASLAAGILKMEFEGRTLDAQDIARKTLLIEQPVQPLDDQNPFSDTPGTNTKAANEPFFLKPSIESLLQEGKPVPEIKQLLAGEISILRPILSSIHVTLPEELTAAVNASRISTASILIQNHVEVFSTVARRKEADELVSIATHLPPSEPEKKAIRLREILGLNL